MSRLDDAVFGVLDVVGEWMEDHQVASWLLEVFVGTPLFILLIFGFFKYLVIPVLKLLV